MPAPYVIRTSAETVAADPRVLELMDRLRDDSDACVFVCGGAGNMPATHRAVVRGALEAVARVHRLGPRLVVGDGGTKAGVMELLGDVRAASGNAFHLLGIAPAREVAPEGATLLDPHHSHVVTVDDPSWTGTGGWWGAETPAMFEVFNRLAAARASVAVVADGGLIALDEVERHVEAGRTVIVLAGTGRTADALARGLGHLVPDLHDGASLSHEIARRGLLHRPSAFDIVPVEGGADLLTARLQHALLQPASATR